ncbi:hypothetical protein [Caldibacillus debilis]|uniref:hypothetical protein n=1 Tax=Caldibacillus debilis TaxID=301148 RepID=UPI00077928DD|nr:hypothetical protein [Caldibacillus debilis]
MVFNSTLCSASYFDDIFIAQCLRFFDDDIVGFSSMVAILDIAVVHVYTLDLQKYVKYHKKLTDIKKEICQFLSHASIFQDKRADFPQYQPMTRHTPFSSMYFCGKKKEAIDKPDWFMGWRIKSVYLWLSICDVFHLA